MSLLKSHCCIYIFHLGHPWGFLEDNRWETNMLKNPSVADQGGATAPSTKWIVRIARTHSRQTFPRACELMHLQTHPDVLLREWTLGKIVRVPQKKWKLLILLFYFKIFFWRFWCWQAARFSAVVGGRITQAFWSLFCSPQRRKSSPTKVSA